MSNISTNTLFSHSRKLLLHIALHQPAHPPTTHHDTKDPYSSQSTFDANVIIVLSLLVCGLICSIGVNFIVRCAVRCIRSPPSAYEPSSAQMQNTGVEKNKLIAFTTLKYSEGKNLPGLGTECVICLSEFKSSERVRILPKCNHGFHVQCIDKWLGQHSSCPTCRNCLIGTGQKIVDCSDLPVPTPATRETILNVTPEVLICNRDSQ